MFLIRHLVFGFVLYAVALSENMSAGTAGMYFSFVSTTIDEIERLVSALVGLD